MLLLKLFAHQLLHDEFFLIIEASLVILNDHVVDVALEYLGMRVQYDSLLLNNHTPADSSKNLTTCDRDMCIT